MFFFYFSVIWSALMPILLTDVDGCCLTLILMSLPNIGVFENIYIIMKLFKVTISNYS